MQSNVKTNPYQTPHPLVRSGSPQSGDSDAPWTRAAGLYFCCAVWITCVVSTALVVWLAGPIAPAVFVWLVSPCLFAAWMAFLIRARWLPSLVFLVTTMAFAAYGSYQLLQVIVVAPDPQGGIAVMFTPVVQWAIAILGSLLTGILWLGGVGRPSRRDKEVKSDLKRSV